MSDCFQLRPINTYNRFRDSRFHIYIQRERERERFGPEDLGGDAMSSERVYVEHCKGINGLDKVVLREVRGSSAEESRNNNADVKVYLYGGQVTSWKNDHGEELLFVSSKDGGFLVWPCEREGELKAMRQQRREKFLNAAPCGLSLLELKEWGAIFKPPKAIRGGIPLCFPQFGSHGPLEQHGFARNRFWSVDPDPPPFATNRTNKAFIDLILKHSEEDAKTWPHRYEFRLRVTLGPGGDLMLTSRIRNTNTDGKSFTFTFAYNNYFSVSDISEVRIEGLETLDYLDNLQDRQRFTEQGDAITFESEVDKVYVSTPTKIAILDHEKKRTFVLRKDGLPDAVVWNPWDKKAKAIPDLGDDDYKHMLCVEAAAVEKPITLKPGEEWKGRQELSAVPSSYCSGQLDPLKVLLFNSRFGASW
ncbi:unnamed protein product [Camellia sinensis]